MCPVWWLLRICLLPNKNQNTDNHGEHMGLAMYASDGEDDVGLFYLRGAHMEGSG